MDFEKVVKKLTFDITAGATCGLLVTPIVSAVDRALAEVNSSCFARNV